MSVALDTIFLKPGTIVSYINDGVRVTTTIDQETEVGLVSVVANNVYIIKWGDAEATAVEPS